MEQVPLVQPQLPRWAPLLMGVIVLGLGLLGWLIFGLGLVPALVLAFIAFLVALPLWVLSVEGRRAAVDRLATTLVWSAFGVAIIPLTWLMYTVFKEGASTVNVDFLTFQMRNVIGDQQGGLYHALIGTLHRHAGGLAHLGAGGHLRRDLRRGVRQEEPARRAW